MKTKSGRETSSTRRNRWSWRHPPLPPQNKKSLLQALDLKSNPFRMSSQLKNASHQLLTRKYKNLVPKHEVDVLRKAVVNHSNLVLMDPVEIEKDGVVIESMWDETVKQEYVITLVSSSSDKGTKLEATQDNPSVDSYSSS